MRAYTLTHVSDAVLMRDLVALVAENRNTTANLLAHIAEVDARRLYLPAGFSSMYAYCVEELHLSEGAAYKRIQVARTAKEFPILFPALADGRVHMTAVLLLAPHLNAGNVEGLIAAATHQTRSGVEQLLARHFPRPEVQRLDDGISLLSAPRPVQELARGRGDASQPRAELAPGRVVFHGAELAPGRVEAPRTIVAPLSPERFSVEVTIDRSTHDKLHYAQQLLGHAVPSGEVALVLDRALDALIEKLEKRKFAATAKPARPRPSVAKRCLPAHVRRAVWERDQGRCTFVSENGHHCATRSFLEFDHVEPVARGGTATVEGIRLRCRAHNQFDAERTFGAGFMRKKREQAFTERQPQSVRRATTRTVSVSDASP